MQLTTATGVHHAGRLQLNIRSSRTCNCTEKRFRPNRTVALPFADLNKLKLQNILACMPGTSCALCGGHKTNHQPDKRLRIPGDFLLFYAYFLFRSSCRGVPPAANPREPPQECRISHASSPERARAGPCGRGGRPNATTRSFRDGGRRGGGDATRAGGQVVVSHPWHPQRDRKSVV